MPRQPDPDLEERILKAAQTLWKRGGDKALTLRAVARNAGTNTPAVYRRFRNRQELVRGLLLRSVGRIRKSFEEAQSVEEMSEAYVDLALEDPHEFELFYSHASHFSVAKGSGKSKAIRESRPNFGLVEKRLADRLGGTPADHTQLALALWALMHGTTTLLLLKAIPGHEEELRSAGRMAVKALIEREAKSAKRK